MEQGNDSFYSISEESGWTAYLRDFSKDSYGRDEELGYNFSSSCCSSLASDAGSHARQLSLNLSDRIVKAPKRVHLAKKTMRPNVITLEDPLEDTASSPVNSPRFVDRNRPSDAAHIIRNSRKRVADHHRIGPGLVRSEVDGRRSIKLSDEHSSCPKEKKKGAGLVPLPSLLTG